MPNMLAHKPHNTALLLLFLLTVSGIRKKVDIPAASQCIAAVIFIHKTAAYIAWFTCNVSYRPWHYHGW